MSKTKDAMLEAQEREQHERNEELDHTYHSRRRAVKKEELSDDAKEVLWMMIENHTDPLEIDDLGYLQIDGYGNYYIPVGQQYESQVEEAWGMPVEMGGWHFTEYELLISAKDFDKNLQAYINS